MRKLVLIALTVVLFGNIQAQENATPNKVNGKDVYVLLLNKLEYKNVGSVNLNVAQIEGVSTIEERIKLFIKNTQLDFDAIMTRNGNSAMLMKYTQKPKVIVGSVIKISNKDVYFFSQPVKKYNSIDSKLITKTEMSQGFNDIVDTYLKNAADFTYDAIIITKDKVEYIIYK